MGKIPKTEMREELASYVRTMTEEGTTIEYTNTERLDALTTGMDTLGEAKKSVLKILLLTEEDVLETLKKRIADLTRRINS